MKFVAAAFVLSCIADTDAARRLLKKAKKAVKEAPAKAEPILPADDYQDHYLVSRESYIISQTIEIY